MEHIRVQYHTIIPFFVDKVKEIVVVNASRFHTYQDILVKVKKHLFELGEASGVHGECSASDMNVLTFQGSGKGIFSHIHSTEIDTFVHVCTSLFRFSEGLYRTLALNLLLQMGNSCPINLYETRRVQNKLLYEPLRSGKMVFHPLGLYFTNTVHIHKHNFINNII